MRLAFTAVFVLMLFLPLVSSAETTAELQAKIDLLLSQIKVLQERIAGTPTQAPVITTPVTTAGSCPSLSRLLTVGSRGIDVTALQDYLRTKGYMNDASSGYFGAITEAAVKKLQVANNIVSSGTAATTGYGAVGPKTRTVIASLCASAAASSVTTQVPQCAQATSPTAPTIACGGTWEKLQNLGCHVGWRCVLPYSGANKPPIVSAIQGPASLGIDVFGSWKVSAIDPEGGALSYSFTWGDEGVADILSVLAGLGGTFSSASSATHSYAKIGMYTLQVNVKDAGGATAVGTVTIKVTADGTQTPITTPSNPAESLSPTGTAAACITPWASQVVGSGGSVYWQPFFTDGLYFATTSPLMKCDNGGWKKCDAAGNSCQVYVHPTSTPSTAALPSFGNTIGQSCSPEGSTKQAQVPAGTQLCQGLSCRTTTQIETITLKCTHSGWTDYAKY